MTDDFESDTKLVPYKEIIKKKTLVYYHANKEVISQKRKERLNSYHLKTKKSC